MFDCSAFVITDGTLSDRQPAPVDPSARHDGTITVGPEMISIDMFGVYGSTEYAIGTLRDGRATRATWSGRLRTHGSTTWAELTSSMRTSAR